MSYNNGNYDGVVYVGTVKWSNDYKNVVNFGSASRRDVFLKNNLKKLENNISALPNPNKYIDINGKLADIEKINYLYYKNDSDFSNTFYCCFVIDWEVIANKTTRLYLQLDVFQQFFYSATYYQSYIKRAHISKNEDNNNWFNYTAPESINFNSIIERNIDTFSDLSFSPRLVLDTVSKPTPKDSPSGTGQLVDYNYGGNGSSVANLTGLYRFLCPNDTTKISAAMYFWSLGETETSTINHLTDLIGFSFIPEWVYTASSWSNYFDLLSQLNSNAVVTASDTASINLTSLACGYQPVNKKMFTSLARALKLWTKNGVSIPIAPELLANRNALTINLSMRPMGSTYKVELVGYKDLTTRYFDLQYSYNIALGLNANVGTAQQTALQQLNLQGSVLKTHQLTNGINTAVNAVAGVAGGIMSIASENVAGGVASIATSLIGGATSAQNQYVENRLANFNQELSVNNALSSIPQTIGTNSDRTTMSNDFCKIRLADVSPTITECKIIDDFLTAYGYSIQELKPPQNFFHSRPVFNFIQTMGMNLKLNAPSIYEQALKKIFDSGLTLWHCLENDYSDYANYGNYSIQNW